MCLLLYVVILRQIVVTIVWYCIQVSFLFFFSFIIRSWLCLQANQSVFVLYDVEKINYIKECIRLTAVGRKKSTFICTRLK